jgi:hypothetical protein
MSKEGIITLSFTAIGLIIGMFWGIIGAFTGAGCGLIVGLIAAHGGLDVLADLDFFEHHD